MAGDGERWTALQIFHYYTRVCTAPPQHIFGGFWIAHKKVSVTHSSDSARGVTCMLTCEAVQPVLPNCNRGTNQTPLKTT